MTDDAKPTPAKARPKPAKQRGTRQEQLGKLLTRKSGVTIAQIQKAFGWQPHTAWAVISRQRKAGHSIKRSETSKGSLYRIVSEARSG